MLGENFTKERKAELSAQTVNVYQKTAIFKVIIVEPITVQIRYLGILLIHIVEEIKLLMLPSDRLLMTSRLATVGRACPRRRIRGCAHCLVTWNMWRFIVGYFSKLYTVMKQPPNRQYLM
jgi:hypothetical protein